jgi:hypothetical protein
VFASVCKLLTGVLADCYAALSFMLAPVCQIIPVQFGHNVMLGPDMRQSVSHHYLVDNLAVKLNIWT